MKASVSWCVRRSASSARSAGIIRPFVDVEAAQSDLPQIDATRDIGYRFSSNVIPRRNGCNDLAKKHRQHSSRHHGSSMFQKVEDSRLLDALSPLPLDVSADYNSEEEENEMRAIAWILGLLLLVTLLALPRSVYACPS